MTKPKQAQKTLSENTGKTFSVIMPPFSSKGGAQLRKWLYYIALYKHQRAAVYIAVLHKEQCACFSVW